MAAEKVYSRMVPNEKGVLKKRIVKESQLTADDIRHFCKELAEVYNASPVGVKRWFFEEIAPPMIQLMNDEQAEREADISLSIAQALGGDTETVN